MHHELGSIRWAKAIGENSLRNIKKIAAESDYEKVKLLFDFYSDGRTARGATLRAIKNAPKLVGSKAHYVSDGMLYALAFHESIESGIATYHPMRQLGGKAIVK